MKVILTVVGIRNYCRGEEKYPELFARLPIGCEVVLRTNRTGEPYPGSISVYDMEMKQIGSICKTDRRFIELGMPEDGTLYATVTDHSARHNCIYIEAENTNGIKEPYLREIVPEMGEIVFAKTAQDMHMEHITDLAKSQLERLKERDITEQQTKTLLNVLTEYSKLCCTSLDGESSFKRADIIKYLRDLAGKHVEFQQFYDDIFEKTKDLGRKQNDVKVEVYLKQYQNIYASATAKGKNGKSQIDEWIDVLKFTHGGVLPESVISEEMNRLANLLSGEMMNKYITCIDSDEDFATALYSLNYLLRSIYVLYTRRIKYNYLKNLLCGNGKSAENQDKEETATGKWQILKEKLQPVFYTDEESQKEFDGFITFLQKTPEPTDITAEVKRLTYEAQAISNKQYKTNLHKILHDEGIYPRTFETWRQQVD